jgi:FkbM family methyltransferase
VEKIIMKLINVYLKLKRKLGISFSNKENNYIYAGMISDIPGVSDLKHTKDFFQFSRFNIPTFARPYPSSDVLVSNQVFVLEEYKHVVDFFKDNMPGYDKLNIIDAGANVGYASAYFIANFPLAEIVCVEPSGENVKMIEKNLDLAFKKGKVTILQNALMDKPDINILIKTDFRDGSDWSLTVEETKEETTLKSVSISNIIAKQNWEHADILKMDIEGAERFVFNDSADLSYLQKVKVMAIEIHDEFNIRKNIYDLLISHDFLILNFAQTTFCINKRFFCKS